MRFNMLQLLKNLRFYSHGKEINDADILNWANLKVKSCGRSRMESFRVESSSGAMNEMANSMMQKFWDSALALEPPDDTDSHSEMSTALMNSEGTEGKYTSLGLGSSFSFKFTDLKGNVHRFNFGR
ncbi:hypothetical protein RND81_04G042700 [Saponaria officinalis]